MTGKRKLEGRLLYIDYFIGPKNAKAKLLKGMEEVEKYKEAEITSSF